MQPVCDLHLFPRLADETTDSVMRGVHHRVVVVTDPATKATHTIRPFPQFSRSACERLLAPMQLTPMQHANLVTWFASHATLRIADVYAMVVRVSTRYGRALMRTTLQTCPLEQLFDADGRNYLETADAVAAVVSRRQMDLHYTPRRNGSAEAATLDAFVAKLYSQSTAALVSDAASLEAFNALCVAFVLQPAWFKEFVSPTPHNARSYESCHTGHPGTNNNTNGTGKSRVPKRGRQEHEEEEEDNGRRGAGGAAAASSSSSSSSSRGRDKGQRVASSMDVSGAAHVAPPPPPHLSAPIENIIISFLDSDLEGVRFLEALCYKPGESRWTQYEIKQRVDLFDFQTHPIRGKLLHVVLNHEPEIYVGIVHPPYTLTIPSSVLTCRMEDGFVDGTIEFAPGSHLSHFYMGNYYNKADIVLPRSVRVFMMGNAFTHSLTFVVDESPHRLESFYMGRAFNRNLVLPHTAKDVLLGDFFNSALAYDGPIHLKKLRMGTAFNQPGVCAFGPIDEIEMDDDYNQSDFVVSRFTTRLYLGSGFKQPLRFEYGPRELLVQQTEVDQEDEVDEDDEVGEEDDANDDHVAVANAADSESKNDAQTPSFYARANELFAASIGQSAAAASTAASSGDSRRKVVPGMHFHQQARANNPRLYAAAFGTAAAAAATAAASSTTSTQNHVMLSVLRELDTGSRYNLPCHGLPGSLKVLTFGAAFKNAFSFHSPPMLSRLTLPGSRPELSVPAGTRHLTITGDYEPPQLIVPTGVRILDLHRTFNRPLQFQAPCTLRTWNMPDLFNVPGLVIPAGMETLQLGYWFNQPVTFSSESRLRKIDMGHAFDRDICLPSSVTHVYTSEEFNHKVTFSGFATLEVFNMGVFQNSPGFRLDGASVVKFRMGHYYNQADFVMPAGVRFFYMGDYFNHPLTLRAPLSSFHMGDAFNAPLSIDGDCELRIFRAGLMFNQPGLRLPHTLRELSLTDKFTHSYDIVYPTHEMTVWPLGCV